MRSSRGGGKPASDDRRCPRCEAPNSRVLEEDQYGTYIKCLSCSASEELPDRRRPNLPFARSKIVHRRDLDAAEDSQGIEIGGVD